MGDIDFDKDRKDSKFDEVLNRQEYKDLKGDLTHFVIILDLMNSQIFKSRIISTEFIIITSKLLEMMEGASFTGSEEFLNILLLTIECLSSVHK